MAANGNQQSRTRLEYQSQLPYHHKFFIPVMGTGYSADTPIRVAPLGISSVISLVDDWLLEQLGGHYAKAHGLPYRIVARDAVDGRAQRITAYLDLVDDIVQRRMAAIKAEPFFEDNDKRRYFELLPEDCALAQDYARFLIMPAGHDRQEFASCLTERMAPGSIDVNIMVKVDRPRYASDGAYLGDEYRDAMSALRGYARSKVSSSLVLSAGVNRKLIGYMTEFDDFYREETGWAKKRIVVKVSDFRSARIQGKFLARKGLEVAEYRVESGLNCGGHAFPTDGRLMPGLLTEFAEHREELREECLPAVRDYYEKVGKAFHIPEDEPRLLLTVQGGIGTEGEARRLLTDYGFDRTGWATPFLLVPEATCADDDTRRLLAQAGPGDAFVSDASPLAVPFNNLRQSRSTLWTARRVAEGRPGSPCPKGFAKTNTEFSERPICVSSRLYQSQKLREIDGLEVPDEAKARMRALVTARACICDHLGNAALISLGLRGAEHAPQAVCPGPNIIWFDRTYTLREMVDHIYGRRPSLVPPQRPHMFAQEAAIYVDYIEQEVAKADDPLAALDSLTGMRELLEEGLLQCLKVGRQTPYRGENLASIEPAVRLLQRRLAMIFAPLSAKEKA